jgi:hypothetical protein
LEVEDEQIEAEIDRVSEIMGDQADQMREMLQSPGGRLSVTDDLLMAKVQELVTQIGKGEAPPLEAQVEGEQEIEAGADAETDSEVEGDTETGVEAEHDVPADTGSTAGTTEAEDAEADAGETD